MTYPRRGVLAQMWGVPGIVFGVFFVVGLVIAVVAVVILLAGRNFAAHGVDVTGRVEKLWETAQSCQDDRSNSSRTCTGFNVGFGFEAGGQLRHGSTQVGYDFYAGLGEGMPVKVRYLAEDPTDYAVAFGGAAPSAMGNMGWVSVLVGGIGSVFLLLGGIGLAVLWRIAWRQVGLRDWGAMRGAVVLAQEATNVTINDRLLWRIRWQDDSGAQGESRGRDPGYLPDVGARITVYADPDGRLASVWEVDSGTR
ncbi:MAG: DUF3592 domain-containing protein [bacterium]